MDSKTLCLAALSLGEASGYEIKKLLDQPPFDHFQDTGFGSIYPALTRLAREGLVEGTAQAQEKRPDKITYRLTEAGRGRLIEALSRPPAPDRFKSDFLLVLFMSDLLPRPVVARAIDERILLIEQELAEMRDCEPGVVLPGHRFVFDLGLAYYGAVLQFLRDNKAKLLAGNPEAARDVSPEASPAGASQEALP